MLVFEWQLLLAPHVSTRHRYGAHIDITNVCQTDDICIINTYVLHYVSASRRGPLEPSRALHWGQSLQTKLSKLR